MRNFTIEEKIILNKAGVANGCGREGGLSFSKIMRFFLTLLPNYIHSKGLTLLLKIEKFCFAHDCEYYEGNSLLEKFQADWNFCKRLYLKLHWTFFLARIVFVIIVFLGLSIVGHLAFNYGVRRYIDDILDEYKNKFISL